MYVNIKEYNPNVSNITVCKNESIVSKKSTINASIITNGNTSLSYQNNIPPLLATKYVPNNRN